MHRQEEEKEFTLLHEDSAKGNNPDNLDKPTYDNPDNPDNPDDHDNPK